MLTQIGIKAKKAERVLMTDGENNNLSSVKETLILDMDFLSLSTVLLPGLPSVGFPNSSFPVVIYYYLA